MTEEDNRLMEELEKRRRKNEEARRRKDFSRTSSARPRRNLRRSA